MEHTKEYTKEALLNIVKTENLAELKKMGFTKKDLDENKTIWIKKIELFAESAKVKIIKETKTEKVEKTTKKKVIKKPRILVLLENVKKEVPDNNPFKNKIIKLINEATKLIG